MDYYRPAFGIYPKRIADYDSTTLDVRSMRQKLKRALQEMHDQVSQAWRSFTAASTIEMLQELARQVDDLAGPLMQDLLHLEALAENAVRDDRPAFEVWDQIKITRSDVTYAIEQAKAAEVILTIQMQQQRDVAREGDFYSVTVTGDIPKDLTAFAQRAYEAHDQLQTGGVHFVGWHHFPRMNDGQMRIDVYAPSAQAAWRAANQLLATSELAGMQLGTPTARSVDRLP